MSGDKERDEQDKRRLEEVAKDLKGRAAEQREIAERAKEKAAELEREERQVEEVVREIDERDNGGHDDPPGGGDCHDEPIAIAVVVNTQRIEVEVTPEEHLAKVRAQALQDTQNVARPPEDYDVKTEGNVVLDAQSTVADAGLKAGSLIFVSLRAGVAGA